MVGGSFIPPSWADNSETRTVVTTYLFQVDGLKSDLTKTSRYDIPPESSSLKEWNDLLCSTDESCFQFRFISHLPI